ncbi:TadE/TadG family type IV pilus assembly protein [Achromobacter sp. ES-001]|uniref:TadE/TadG family type IV pilus assembly protein n=1 Tax=Achromobacter sp. ES-001 TaxID=2860286 RepID=UPI002101E7B6|nr:TadE/TadG family type IV pilus assembly protein [Achromobacter sp. ES-001]
MSSMSTRAGFPAAQQGQAMIEALLMLPLMAALVWGVTWIGGLQFSAQQLAHASRKAAMAGALGEPVTPRHSFAAAAQTRRVFGLADIAAPNLSRLQHEWFGAGLHLLAVYARSAPSGRDGPPAPLITRHTHVAVGTGHAHGDADARRRIANAPTAWRHVEQASLAEARRMAPYVQRMDRAWGRAAIHTDWLSAWDDVVPPDRLGQQKERSR